MRALLHLLSHGGRRNKITQQDCRLTVRLPGLSSLWEEGSYLLLKLPAPGMGQQTDFGEDQSGNSYPDVNAVFPSPH